MVLPYFPEIFSPRQSKGWINSDVIIGAMASQIISLTIVYSTVYSGADQRKHQNSASLAFVWGIHRWTANVPPKWPVTRKMFPFDNVIMISIFHVKFARKCVLCTCSHTHDSYICWLRHIQLTWIEFHSGIDKLSHVQWGVKKNHSSIP